VSARRCCTAAGTVAPAAVLVLLPKCPACIAAWLAVGAGIGVTATTAAYLRTGLLVLCVACLAWVVGRLWRSRQAGP
jgi:threonine/homoserine/homoserine lactone efflux protein